MTAWFLKRRTVTRCDQNTAAGLEIPSEVNDEIVLLMLLMPLMHVNMRLQVSHLAVWRRSSVCLRI